MCVLQLQELMGQQEGTTRERPVWAFAPPLAMRQLEQGAGV